MIFLIENEGVVIDTMGAVHVLYKIGKMGERIYTIIEHLSFANNCNFISLNFSIKKWNKYCVAHT